MNDNCDLCRQEVLPRNDIRTLYLYVIALEGEEATREILGPAPPARHLMPLTNDSLETVCGGSTEHSRHIPDMPKGDPEDYEDSVHLGPLIRRAYTEMMRGTRA
jgi:hypothetical protein